MPASRRSRGKGGAVCSLPASQRCSCHPAGLLVCPPIGKVCLDSGEKSQAPTGNKINKISFFPLCSLINVICAKK